MFSCVVLVFVCFVVSFGLQVDLVWLVSCCDFCGWFGLRLFWLHELVLLCLLCCGCFGLFGGLLCCGVVTVLICDLCIAVGEFVVWCFLLFLGL